MLGNSIVFILGKMETILLYINNYFMISLIKKYSICLYGST